MAQSMKVDHIKLSRNSRVFQQFLTIDPNGRITKINLRHRAYEPSTSKKNFPYASVSSSYVLGPPKSKTTLAYFSAGLNKR